MATATWQASDGTLDGDWAQAAHWDSLIVPDITTAVTIAGADNPIGWIVTATNAAAASLALDMGQGTLLVSAGFTVAGTLNQVSGSFAATQGATLQLGAINQSGGTITLRNTAMLSVGPDVIDGDAALSGSDWRTDAGLTLANAAVAASLTLAAASSLSLDGMLTLGSDPTSGAAGGVGSLELDGTSSLGGASGLTLRDGSAIALDSTSSLAIASATAAAGTLTLGRDGVLDADLGSIAGAVANAGALTVTAFPGGQGSLSISGALSNTGAINIAASATLSASALALTAGNLVVNGGGELDASAGVAVAGGGFTINGGALISGGPDVVDATARLVDGGLWDTGSLTLGQAGRGSLLVQGATLADSGGLTLGNDAGGAAGTLTLTEGSTADAAGLQLLDGSLVTLDATSALTLGSATAAAGTLAVGTDGTLAADIATIDANLALAGGLTVANGGRRLAGDLSVDGSLSGAGTVSVRGRLAVANAAGFTGAVTLQAGARLTLASGDLALATIDVAARARAAIDLAGVAFPSAGAFRYQPLSGQISFGAADAQATLDVNRGLKAGAIKLTADGHGGTLVSVTAAPCYAAGSRVATARGMVGVEALRVGDAVVTRAGRLAPVIWVGWTRLDLARHPQPWRAAPLRIAADAIADGVPCRDLVVSPDHALWFDGALVPAWQLANGATIARQDVMAVTYYHVELDHHDIMMVENCPAESYLDTGNRGLFANAAGVRALHPDLLGGTAVAAALAIWAARAVAPLLLGGPRVTALRARLAARAAALGWQVANAPDLALTADGLALPLRMQERSVFTTVPATARRLRLRSRVFIPAETVPGADDRRRLGVAVARALLGGWPLPEVAFAHGWHEEAAAPWRWSDGDATLALPRLAKPTRLELRLAATGRYWLAPAARAA